MSGYILRTVSCISIWDTRKLYLYLFSGDTMENAFRTDSQMMRQITALAQHSDETTIFIFLYSLTWLLMPVTVIDAAFCMGQVCDKQTQDTFQPSRLTGVRLWAVITLQTVWWEMGGRSRSWNDYHSVFCVCRVYFIVTGAGESVLRAEILSAGRPAAACRVIPPHHCVSLACGLFVIFINIYVFIKRHNVVA